jgi:hypothetical protein
VIGDAGEDVVEHGVAFGDCGVLWDGRYDLRPVSGGCRCAD